MGQLRAIVDRFPTLKAFLKFVLRPLLARTSSGYSLLDNSKSRSVALDLIDAWRSEAIPELQRAGIDRALAAYRAGSPNQELDMFVDMINQCIPKLRPATAKFSLLETGCASGYYSEVLSINDVPVRYSGCDYSEALIKMARSAYPNLAFDVDDATCLTYPDGKFDVVVSGCCLLHIYDYQKAICEAARVARSHVLFHRTPILHQRPTTFFTKKAYGNKVLEIHFNEHELVTLFTNSGLRVIDIRTLNAAWRKGDAYATKSYLCEKT